MPISCIRLTDILRGVFGVRGQVFRDYANGIESEPMTRSEVKDNSYGNSVTTPQDLSLIHI